MEAFAANIDYWLAAGTIAMQVVTIVLIGAFVLRERYTQARDIVAKTAAWIWPVAFGTSLFASVMTLVYSEVFGIPPCPLCWWQRVFLYPQIILLGMAWRKRDAYIAEYSIVLSVFGFLVAMYHHALQMFPGSGLPCPATGVSCAQRYFFQFDYVTYPLMAATLFAFLVILMLIVRSRRD